ncbi:MAG: hypothetical protein ACFFC7_16330 [Candidatus Hermodarchaeota archaeon]
MIDPRKERTAKATAARIQKQQDLTKKRQKTILDAIETEPGINLTKLKKITSFRYSTVQHIVKKLDDENKIITKYSIGDRHKAVKKCYPLDYLLENIEEASKFYSGSTKKTKFLGDKKK